MHRYTKKIRPGTNIPLVFILLASLLVLVEAGKMQKPAILIVEDEKIIAIDLQIRLEGMDYDVVACVSTGEEALLMVQTRRVNLVLMDIMIDGDMDGIETASLIHQHADLPIIFLTAYADENTFSRSSNSEPYAYILKPFQERELDLTIRTVLQKHSLEMRLRQSEARYRTLFEQTREAILILNSDAAISEANGAARALLEMRGLSKADTLHDFFPESGRHLFSVKWELFKAGENIKGRFSFVTSAKQTKVIEYKIQGNYLPGMHIAVLTNITASVVARRKIENLARFPAEAPNPILRISPLGEILYFNAAGTDLVNDWKPVYGNRIPDNLRKRLVELGPKSLQLRSTIKADNRFYSLLFVYVPKSNYINIYATDITRQKASERVTGFQKDVMEMIAKGNPLQSVADQLVKRLEHFIHGCKTVVLITEPEQNLLVPAGTHNTDNRFIENLLACFNTPEQGGKPFPEMAVLIHETSAPSAETELLRESGYKTLWLSPVWSMPTQYPSVFCVFFNRQHNPAPMEVSLVNIACKVMALALERELSLRSLYKQALVFENINDAVVLTDSQGRVTQWNPSAQKIFGFSSTEMLGRNLLEAGLFERSNRVEKLLRLVQGNADGANPKWTDEFNFRTKHAENGIAEVSFIKLNTDSRPAEAGTLVVMRDVTLKRRVEIALSTSEANLIALIENTEDIIFSIDKEMALVTFNSAFVRVVKSSFGTKVVPGLPLHQVLTDDLFSVISNNIQEALSGRPLRSETRLELKGRALDLEINVNPIFTEEGRLNGISLFARDITLRKEAENELKRTNFELDSFVYRASHDLRAPLRSVLGLVNILGFETNEEEKKLYLSLIEKSVNKLDNFIADLTNFSRNSRMEVKAEPIDFKHIVDEVMENLRYMENANSVTLHFSTQGSVPFYSDPSRISIIMQNLLSNAIKYRRHGSVLAPFDAWVKVSIEYHKSKAVLSVQDNGKGINPQYTERVFDMFFRASEDSYGSGLGLYITRQVVEKLKGEIVLHSEPGVGTHFTITLPNLQGVTIEEEAG